MNGMFSFKEILALGWPILSVLLFCSVVSLAVALERWLFFRKRRVQVGEFPVRLEEVLGAGKNALTRCSALGEPMSAVTHAALVAFGSNHSSIELSVDRAVRMQVAEMERFVPTLGTIAGVAPFIGLLGTVLGIIRAFRTLAVTGAGGPQVVAGGIAEALIATAFGLIVAIPALVFYNHFSTRIRRTTENMEICSDHLVEVLARLRPGVAAR